MFPPPIFYPKTSVHGFVADQYDAPVSNVGIEVWKDWPFTFLSVFTYDCPHSKWNIRSDEQGRWKVSTRKVGRLFVEAIPPEGYRLFTKRLEKAGPFGSGECPTNEFILRLEKLPTPEKGGK